MGKGDKANNNIQKSKAKEKKEVSKVVKAYLVFYNVAQTLGWSYLLYQILDFYLVPTNRKTSLYDTIKWTLFIFQNGAALEIVHALLRIVQSSPMITIQQVASRVTVVCGVWMIAPESKASVGLLLALFAWTVTEIIRYANYALNLLNAIPYVLIWLRYSTFVFLYPIGVTGELLCLYAAQKQVRENKWLTLEMPNIYNFAFHYDHFLIFVMLLYIPLFPQMYLHMFSQRKKVLGRHEEQSKKVK